MVATRRALAFCLLLAFRLPAQTVYTYIGQLSANSVLIAWGNTLGGAKENTIGRDAASLGRARVQVGDRSVSTEKCWAEVKDLVPDTAYPYDVQINGRSVGRGTVRTWPEHATRMAFFVIGDYGNASDGQRGVAQAMLTEFQKRAQTDNPVRFVLTLGDNIYADVNMGYVILRSGNQDKDWEPKFFAPYRDLLRQIPFFPTLGNHDGNASENRDDLNAYLDNFFFPGNQPARWYQFSFGGLADFFGLDSTDNTTAGHPAAQYAPEGDQSRWLAGAIADSKSPWKIPYFHHPPFNAGPGHGASYNVLRHWVDLFAKSGVRVVFTGHEHNFQMSESSALTGGARYFVSGAGGALRAGNVQPSMDRAHIDAWSPQRHFLVVEIEGRTMKVTPVSDQKLIVKDRNGKDVSFPFMIQTP